MNESELDRAVRILSRRDAIQRCLLIKNRDEALGLFAAAFRFNDFELMSTLVIECAARVWGILPVVDGLAV